MERYTYFDGGKWRLKIGDTEYSGDWVDRLSAYEETGLEPEELAQVMASLEDEMSRASADMDFERAAAMRDQLVELKSRFEGGSAAEVMERLKAGARKGSAHATRRRYRGKH